MVIRWKQLGEVFSEAYTIRFCYKNILEIILSVFFSQQREIIMHVELGFAKICRFGALVKLRL
jgi:hypothetical protein